jgi:hypothetical protein
MGGKVRLAFIAKNANGFGAKREGRFVPNSLQLSAKIHSAQCVRHDHQQRAVFCHRIGMPVVTGSEDCISPISAKRLGNEIPI